MVQFMAPKAVCAKVALSRTTLDRLVQAGDFPRAIKLTDRRVAFNAADVEEWMLARLRKQRSV